MHNSSDNHASYQQPWAYSQQIRRRDTSAGMCRETLGNCRWRRQIDVVANCCNQWDVWTLQKSSPAFALLLSVVLALFFASSSVVGDERQAFELLGMQFERDVRPLVKRFCLECHSTDGQEGEVDLEQFNTFNEVRRDPKSWQKVLKMLEAGEMPPEDSEQPSLEESELLNRWVRSYLDLEAHALAGDPGSVVLRRLNNAEYTYTIRDLTGIELDPAREFATTGAAGEGFTNVGNALVMSAGLLQQFFDAGSEIAEHVVLTPEGFRFSAHATPRDWSDEMTEQVRQFYGDFVDNQETKFGRAGVLPLEKYLAATLLERDALATNTKTIETVAEQQGLNARYLRVLWSSLLATDPSLLLEPLRERWRNAQPEDAAALAADIASWQKGLWVFNPIGLLGRKGSRAKWLEPVNPLLTQYEMHFQFPELAEGEEEKQAAEEVVFSLVATDAGDGNEHDFVVWQQPRLVAEGQPDIMLRDVAAASSRLVSRVGSETDATDTQADDFLLFGKHPHGFAIDPRSFCVRAPSVIEIRLPAKLVIGREFVTTAVLDLQTGGQGSVQPEIVAGVSQAQSELLPSEVIVTLSDINIGADTRTISYLRPILVGEESTAWKRFESAMVEHRRVFPAALCYTQIVPVDELLTLTLFYREDDHLQRLMLDENQANRLDRLWQELRYVSQDPLKQLDVLESLLETTIDHPQEGIFDALVKPFNAKAEAFRQALIESESRHMDALVVFAAKVFRRPLTDEENTGLRDLYRDLREQDLAHDVAFRLTMARVFTAAPFLYRLENISAGTSTAAVSEWELASRLSYFLWSSQPDSELRENADRAALQTPEILVQQTKRMLLEPSCAPAGHRVYLPVVAHL